VAIKAIQEQQLEIEDLKIENKVLKKKQEEMEKRLSMLERR
jgi:FtsZ-binding cell division protein ZapB